MALVYTMKLVLLGASGVGKSSIVLRFVQNNFFPNTAGTIGAAFLTKTVRTRDGDVKLEIWDTAGQERYHALAPMYYRGAHAVLVVYEVTSRASFERAKEWLSELADRSTPDQQVALCGNKVDLPRREVSFAEGQRYAEQNGLLFMETSAKDGTGVPDLFHTLAECMPKDRIARPGTSRIEFVERDDGTGAGCRC